MIVREAVQKDLPQMIALLKKSLGEKLIPKSEEFFLWKHEKNPFGKSLTLLATEEENIIGLRTFMYWKWRSGEKLLSAVRAVDTATDPAFQGKGIFRKLTMMAVDKCTENGVSLVFNTPNPISMQGYLKMGWEIAGRLPVYAGYGSVFPRKWNKETDLLLKEFNPVNIFAIKVSGSNILHTPLSSEYLHWRYRDCPVVNYGSVSDNNWGFVFRLKPAGSFIEMRICEAWSDDASSASSLGYAIKDCIKKYRPLFVTCSASPLVINYKPLGRLFGPFKKGPVTTIRPLALKQLEDFKEFKNWQPSLGSLELF